MKNETDIQIPDMPKATMPANTKSATDYRPASTPTTHKSSNGNQRGVHSGQRNREGVRGNHRDRKSVV